jgi:predicted RND superfamily exporter protein
VTSAVGFFAATFGVSLYSDIDIISSLSSLMARGAIISMFAVIFVLPAFLRLFDKMTIHTTKGLRQMYRKNGKKEVATA